MPFSVAEKNKMLDVTLGSGVPAIVYMAAYVSNAEVSGNGYARVAITNNATNFPAASASSKSNGVDMSFPEASGSWGTIDEVRLHNHITNEDVIGSVTVSKAIGAADILLLQAGDLTIGLNDS